MFNSLRRDFYWLFMVNDVFETVRDFQSCAKARGTLMKFQKHLRLFPANGPFEFFSMDILIPLPKTNSGKRFIVVITNLYSKLTRNTDERYNRPSRLSVFLKHMGLPILYSEFDAYLQRPQVHFSVLSLRMCHPRHKRILITPYHPESNGHTGQ